MTPKEALELQSRGIPLAHNVDLSHMTRFFYRLLDTPAGNVAPTRALANIVRESFYAPRTDIVELLAALRANRHTGRLIIDLREGGVSTIRVREENEFEAT